MSLKKGIEFGNRGMPSETKEKIFLAIFLVFAITATILLFKSPFSGSAISQVTLNKSVFNASELLQGKISLELQDGDLIPQNSTANIYISSNAPRCQTKYVCANNQTVAWYNASDCSIINPDPETTCCTQRGSCINLVRDGYFEISGSKADWIYWIPRPTTLPPPEKLSDSTYAAAIDTSYATQAVDYTIYQGLARGVKIIDLKRGEITTCTDSDNGNNITVKGTCTDSLGSFPDSCYNSTHVIELICSANDACASMMISCGTGKTCAYGACTSSGTSCTDTDGGNNVNVKGTCTDSAGSHTDYCDANNIGYHEYVCEADNLCHDSPGSCLYGCANGACNPNPGGCTDSDGGNNAAVKGTCTDSAGSISDNCYNTTHLTEMVCSASNACVSIFPTIYCGAGKICSNGACISSTAPTVTLRSPVSITISAGSNTFKWIAERFATGPTCDLYMKAPGAALFSKAATKACTNGVECNTPITLSATGSYSWKVNCSNSTGAKATSSTESFSVGGGPQPQIILLYPSNAANIKIGTNVGFEWKPALTSTTTGAQLNCYLKLTTPGGQATAYKSCNNGAECTYSIPLWTLGGYSWKVTCGSATSETRSITVKTTVTGTGSVISGNTITGFYTATCGNGACEAGEITSCPQDCGGGQGIVVDNYSSLSFLTYLSASSPCASEVMLKGNTTSGVKRNLHYYMLYDTTGNCLLPASNATDKYVNVAEISQGWVDHGKSIYADWMNSFTDNGRENDTIYEIWLISHGKPDHGQKIYFDSVKIAKWSATNVSSNCAARGKTCCINNTGIGEYYGSQLTCNEGYECWSSCADSVSWPLPTFISKSDSSSKKNLTYGLFYEVSNNNYIGGEGNGYAYCLNTSSNSPLSSCRDWDNIYTVNASRTGLKAPRQNGDYLLNFDLTYGTGDSRVVIINASTPFSVGNATAVEDCVWTNTTGWRSWSECDSLGYRTRTRNCTAINSPCNDINSTECTTETRYDESCGGTGLRPCTTDDYQCSAWNPSDENCTANETQTKSCTLKDPAACDLYASGSTAPVATKLCAKEQPHKSKLWLWILLIILLLAAVIFIILRLNKKKGGKKAVAPPELISYIKDALATGATKAEIATRLIQAGWPRESVDAAMKALRV